jgi:hypothetical protein
MLIAPRFAFVRRRTVKQQGGERTMPPGVDEKTGASFVSTTANELRHSNAQ